MGGDEVEGKSERFLLVFRLVGDGGRRSDVGLLNKCTGKIISIRPTLVGQVEVIVL